jgi:photosystem II stability/assembly factor-like uncharacterized protein
VIIKYENNQNDCYNFAQEDKMFKPYARTPLVIAMLFLAAFSAGCTALGGMRSYLTVTEVSQRARSLIGKQVRVRGYAYLWVSMTAVLCVPSRCDCNESLGSLDLYAEQPDPAHLNRLFDLAHIRDAETSLKCQGDECSMECSPFDPGLARQFEFVGTLRSNYDNLILEDLDLDASRQWIDEKWFPIKTGQFAVTRAALPTLSLPKWTATAAPLNVWVRHGPEGQGVGALVIDPLTPTTLYAGANGGVFKSTDAAGTWQEFSTGLVNQSVSDLVIDPLTPTTLYAGTLGGVFKSTDGGANWQAANAGLTSLYVQPLAIDPVNPAVLYAATPSGFTLAGVEIGGLFKSTDGGGSWVLVKGLTNPYVSALAFDPTMHTTLYAMTEKGMFKSTDGGGNWNQIGNGLTADFIYVIVIDPTKPATLYAGGHGVFRSTDAGANWSEVGHGLPERVAVSTLLIDPHKPDVLYAASRGVFKSTDGGRNWKAVGKGLADALVGSLVMDPQDSALLYAGTLGGDVYAIHLGK